MGRYDHVGVEKKWQERWEERGVGCSEMSGKGEKFYILEMFPYPSGKIHMGHVRNYSIGDVYARFLKMKGREILHPMGWDAFGLPAENAAIKHGVHPAIWTDSNIEYMGKQLRRLGFLYDWRREFATSSPDYYRWEQSFFLKMLDRGIAFRKFGYVNYCSGCDTILANEQVIDERCWRCEGEVGWKGMEGWFLRITDYAEELLNNLDELKGGWPDRVITMQRNWIGRSEGAFISFPLKGGGRAIEIFTTRLDTVHGVTFLSLAPEYPNITDLSDPSRRGEVSAFVERALRERRGRARNEDYEKEGIFTGRYATNPFNGEEVPIFVANFVVMEYGTGAVMAVPAHDSRDFQFARRYGLPIRVVIIPEGEEPGWKDDPSLMEDAFTEDGVCVNSGRFSGLTSAAARTKMTDHASGKGFGRAGVQYRLKDWGISRQRYWGTPIPVIYCDFCGIVKVPEEDLPVTLPLDIPLSKNEMVPPLSRIPEFVKTRCPGCGGPARRETDTMDTFVESSWYFIKFTSLAKGPFPFDPEEARYWMPVDQYIGGIEHAVLHLMYARFFTMVLRDLGYVDYSEPFRRLLTQGMVTKDGAKMSKSKGNVVDPDETIERFGADTTRLFLLFAAPPERDLDWSFHGIKGCYRFLARYYNLAKELSERGEGGGREGWEDPASLRLLRGLHKTIKKVTEDTGERFQFNTAISAIMEFTNQLGEASRGGDLPRSLLLHSLKALNLLLSPYVPHLSDEVSEMLGEHGFNIEKAWPQYDPSLVEEETVTIVIQVNGRLRGEIRVERGVEEGVVRDLALKNANVLKYLQGKEVKRFYYVRDRLLNIVAV